jgi:hypothetical protein
MSNEHIAIIELEESIIPDGCMRRLDEVQVKHKNEIWRIHKTDSDPFPSKPHAHNVESDLKLDLRTLFEARSAKRESALKPCYRLGLRQWA